jgi:hypothetical protein
MFGDVPNVTVRWKLVVSAGKTQVIGASTSAGVGVTSAVEVASGVGDASGVAVVSGEAVASGVTVASGPVWLIKRVALTPVVAAASGSSPFAPPQAARRATPRIKARAAKRVLIFDLQEGRRPQSSRCYSDGFRARG